MRLDEITAQATTDGTGRQITDLGNNLSTVGLGGLASEVSKEASESVWIEEYFLKNKTLSELTSDKNYSLLASYIISQVGAKDKERVSPERTAGGDSRFRTKRRIPYNEKYYQEVGYGRNKRIVDYKEER